MTSPTATEGATGAEESPKRSCRGPDEAYIVDPAEVAADAAPVEVDAATGLPKVLRAFVVHEDPKITVIPNFVTDAEIEHLLELAKECWVPSVVGSGVYKTNDEGKDLKNQPSKNRTSFSCMLRSFQTPRVRSLEMRLAHLAGMDVDYLERLNLVRYEPGQFFNEHHDGRFRPKTVFVYLNELGPGDGGETYFPSLGLKVLPRKGCAVMWSNVLRPSVEDVRTIHAGLPPKIGMKFGVNCFFNDKPLRQWEDVDSDIGDQDDDEPSVAKPPSSARWRTIDGADLAANAGHDGAIQPLRPGQIRAFCVSQEPKVSVLPAFLAPDESAALASLCSPSTSSTATSGPSRAADVPTEIVQAVEQRMAAVSGLPLSHMEPLKVARCEPHMTPDGQVLAHGQYGQRFGARVVFVFLNSVDEGGEIRFPRLGIQVLPQEGCAVAWTISDDRGGDHPRAVHQGRAPRSGARYCAYGIFRQAPVRGAATHCEE